VNEREVTDGALARRLVLDELFDLSLYQSLRALATDELAAILDLLIPIEARHFTFWVGSLDIGRRPPRTGEGRRRLLSS